MVEAAVAALAAECHAAASHVAEWARVARIGAVLITVPAIGTAEIGMAITAMAETGMAITGTVIIGMAGIITAIM